MVDSSQSTVRFSPDDLAIIAALQSRTGIANRTDILRLAIRKLAVAEGIDVVALTAKPSKKSKS